MTSQAPAPASLLVRCTLALPPLDRPKEHQAGPPQHDHIVLVRVLGELDCSTVPALAEALRSAGERGAAVSGWTGTPAIELDLSGLTFLDTAGIGAIDEARRRLATLGCRLCVTRPSRQALRMLDIAVFCGWLPDDLECTLGDGWPTVVDPIRRPTGQRRHRIPLPSAPTGSLPRLAAGSAVRGDRRPRSG